MFKYILFIWLFIFCSASSATQKINLGVEAINYYPLWGTYDLNDKNTGNYIGLAADIFQMYNKFQNEFEIVAQPRPIKRLYAEFLKQDATLDAKFPDNPYWADDLKKGIKVGYSDSIIDYTDGVFVLKKNNDLTLDKINSMGILAGFTPFDYLDQIKKGQIKIENSNAVTHLLDKLVHERVQTIYINKYIGNCILIKRNEADKVIFINSLPHKDSKYFISSIKYPKLLISFNKFLQEKKEEINKIKQDYIEHKCK